MKIPNEKKKAEAVDRMRVLGVFPETIKQFERDGKLSVSEPPFGAFYWVDDETRQRVREFEEDYNAMVYLVIRSYTTLGKMDNFLYVSDHEDEWEQDRDDLTIAEPLCYVYSYDMPDCSELGYIGIKKTCAAGLLRTY